MRSPAAVLGFVFLTVSSTLVGVGSAAPPDPPGVAAPAMTASIVANRTDAGRTDSVALTAWVNLTGAAPAVEAWVNLTFDPNFLPDAPNATGPGPCSPAGSLSWYCAALGTGSYVWYAEATVSDRATFVVSNATVNATSFDQGDYMWADATVAVQIRGAEIYITIGTLPIFVRPGDRVNITIEAVNDRNASDSAWNVSLRIEADDTFAIDPRTDLTPSTAELTAGSILSTSFQAVVAENATVGGLIGIRIVLVYEDYDYRPIGPQIRSLYLPVLAPEFVTAASLLGAIAVFSLAIVTTVIALSLIGRRRIRIDEVFLMHRSGILIQHHTRGPALKKDDDLVASMLVAVQEFVRDSFRSEATLDEFSFGGRRAAILRGKNVIIAAIISRGDVRYLLPQLKTAVRDIEAAHGSLLANWDGRIARLDRAGPIIETLLRGGYRATRTWTRWAIGARLR